MPHLITKAVEMLSSLVNVDTGLSHPNDMNKAKELFKLLHDRGEILLKSDVVNAALAYRWSATDADELGSLAQQIGEGKNPRIQDGPWLVEGVYERLVGTDQ